MSKIFKATLNGQTVTRKSKSKEYTHVVVGNISQNFGFRKGVVPNVDLVDFSWASSYDKAVKAKKQFVDDGKTIFKNVRIVPVDK